MASRAYGAGTIGRATASFAHEVALRVPAADRAPAGSCRPPCSRRHPPVPSSPTLRTASLDSGLVQASVAGTIRTGAWKLVVDRPGATQRLRVFIERGDIWWGGKVVVQRLVDGRWVTSQRRDLDHAGQLRHTVCADDLGVCVLGGSIKAPQPGAQRLAATFRMHGHGTWSLTGSVRQASEPFILRPVGPGRRGEPSRSSSPSGSRSRRGRSAVRARSRRARGPRRSGRPRSRARRASCGHPPRPRTSSRARRGPAAGRRTCAAACPTIRQRIAATVRRRPRPTTISRW